MDNRPLIAAMLALLTAVLLAFSLPGCAQRGAGSALAELGPTLSEQCSEGRVDVHIVNENAGDVRLWFDGQRRLRAIPGLSEETVQISRTNLRTHITMQVVRGGVGRETIPIGHVVCDEATLYIGNALNQSYFFGADVRTEDERN